jgi:BirA family biotin operon repressor/biotin-[acetyl-CoA-carboxylase] ligase
MRKAAPYPDVLTRCAPSGKLVPKAVRKLLYSFVILVQFFGLEKLAMSNYAYAGGPLLDLTRIAMSLNRSLVGHTLDYHASIPSTMMMALELAARPDTRTGTLVVAEEQTAGLGRLKRAWEAPANQALLLSVILKPPHLPANPAELAMLSGLAVVRAILSIVPDLTDEIGLKWPNDVLLGPDLAAGRKVAGILIETSYRDNEMEFAVVGIGINVNQDQQLLPKVPAAAPLPTSLLAYVGRAINRSDLLIALGQVWNELLGPKRADHDIYQEWRSLLYTLGQPVTVRRHGQLEDQAVHGTAIDVTPDGALVVVDGTGHTHTFGSGDVTTRQD